LNLSLMLAPFRLRFVFALFAVTSTIFEYCLCNAETNYIPVNSLDDHWCYLPYWLESEETGFDFEQAVTQCNSQGDTLPILTSSDLNNDVGVIGRTIWIGIVCSGNDIWQWEDGQLVEFNLFMDKPDANCSNVNQRFALIDSDVNKATWIGLDPSTRLIYGVCARRAHAVVDVGLPAWGIAAIVILALLIVAAVITIVVLVRKKFRQLQETVIEVRVENERQNKELEILADPEQSVRYYNLPSKKDEWEIDRKFVSIDYMSKLGEGAFGSVYIGRVLSKNLPSGTGR
ncbi:hypothetical protein PMAYCL1PPCAC_22085, partial [Pristionchus mayeri]